MATKAAKTKKAAKKAPARKTSAKAAKKAPARKVSAKTSAKKAAPAKKKKSAAKQASPKPAAKKAVKKAAPKTAAKKATVKTSAKKTAAKKPAPAKKAAPKAEKPKAAKKTAAPKTSAPKTAAKKAPAKKAAKGKAAKPAKPVRPKPVNVGQAPRKTTLAASIPVPTAIPLKDAPQADAAASVNNEASHTAKQDFKVNDKIVYPAHGVGKIISLEKQQVAGIAIELFVIDFDQEKMKLRVPTGKAKAAGMRALSDEKTVKDSIALLKGRARIKRTMWSRRAQEYDAKINSGDMKLVAEVVRDLYRGDDQPEQSYSERQLFEAALDRMAREVAAVRNVDLGKAIEELESVLKKKLAAASASAA